jgi:hypothetical protein
MIGQNEIMGSIRVLCRESRDDDCGFGYADVGIFVNALNFVPLCLSLSVSSFPLPNLLHLLTS